MFDYVHLFNVDGHNLSVSNGRQLNFVDYSQYFYSKYKIKSKLLVKDKSQVLKNYNILKDFFNHPSVTILRTLNKNAYSFIDLEYFKTPKSGILVIDFVGLCFLIHNNIYLNYKKIYVFDCLEVTMFFRNIKLPNILSSNMNYDHVLDKISKIKNLTFLITDYNVSDFEKIQNIDYKIYYKKINFNIFNEFFIHTIKDSKHKTVYYYAEQNTKLPDFDDWIKKIKLKYPNIILTSNFMDIWEYSTILYTPKPYVGYIEQFGRMIFELKYFGYNVILDDEFKNEQTTGLDYYLKHYDESVPNLMNEDFLDELRE